MIGASADSLVLRSATVSHNFDGDHCDLRRPHFFLCRDLNEAFASQCLTSRDKLGIDPATMLK
jgi:hypothetical protein